MSQKTDHTAVLPTSPAWTDYVTLIKPRVNLLVLVTTVIGFHLGNLRGTDLPLLFNTVVGTFLVASGAAAFNQLLERDVDAKMRRTMQRPLPDGRIGSVEAFWFATALSAIGLAQLWFGANALAALVAVATLVSYALIYTPLKKAAARDTLSIEAWVLFAIVFVWQMPHVLAISWLYRDDYERGGIRVLPVEEPDGRSTAFQMVSYAAALVPVSLLPAAVGMAGPVYFGGAIVLGVAALALAIRFAQQRTPERARQLFFASLIYLPVLWVLMLANRA